MTLRAALYARYSTDRQNPRSIDDQVRESRAYAERQGWSVVAVFSDAELKGSRLAGRDGLAALMAAARAGQFDVVVAEALDRVTRSGADAWDIFDDLGAEGIELHTLAQGRCEEMAIGLGSTVAALEVRNTARRVHRGMKGVVGEGRLPFAPPYGYRPRIAHDAKGERIKGLVEIVPAEAEILRRAAAEFLAGSSPEAIAKRFNGEGVPGPGGGLWRKSGLLGEARLLRGAFRNPLYAGEIVWNRAQRKVVRRTGAVRIRANAADELVRTPAPHLAIFDPPTWAAIQAKVAERSAAVAAAGNPRAANTPKRLFSGLIRCGVCGGSMAIGSAGPRGVRYLCLARNKAGPAACSNARTAYATDIEAAALAELRATLLHPEAVAAFVDEYRKAAAASAAQAHGRRDTLARALSEAETRAARLVDQVADGVLSGPTVAKRLADLEAEAATLRRQLASLEAAPGATRPKAEVVALHPRAPDRYRQLVDDLNARLARVEADPAGAKRDAARALLRQVITALVFHPGDRPGQWRLEAHGNLTALLDPHPAQAAHHVRARA